MQSLGLLSVVIPVYNSEKYLVDCIQSILDSSYQEFEIILIDDGSDDNSLRLCKSYANSDARIKVISQQNAGQSVARNKGIDMASGKYLTFIDSDDIISRDFFLHGLKMIHEYNADIVVGGYKIAFDDSKKRPDRIPDLQQERLYKGAQINNIIDFFVAYTYNHRNIEFKNCRNILSPWGKIFKGELVKEIRFNAELRYHEDTLFNLEALYRASSVLVVPRIYYYWRQSPDSLTHNNNRSNLIDEEYIALYNFVKYSNMLCNAQIEKALYIRGIWSYHECAKYIIFSRSLSNRDKANKVYDLNHKEIYHQCLSSAKLSIYDVPSIFYIYRILDRLNSKAIIATFIKIANIIKRTGTI